MTRTEEIRARVEKATPGHWWWTGDANGNRALSARRTSPWRDVIAVDRDKYLVVRVEDMAFLSHVRQDVPYLLTELSALREEVERLTRIQTKTENFDAWRADQAEKREKVLRTALNDIAGRSNALDMRKIARAALSPSPAQQEEQH